MKDAISSDKDCIEDLRVYLTHSSQEILNRAMSVKAGCAELLYACVDVEAVSFNRGFYTVDVKYFYRITVDACVGAIRPVEVCGLAMFEKRVVLFGSEGSAKSFSSEDCCNSLDLPHLHRCNMPTAVVESVDPLILNLKLLDNCECPSCELMGGEIPAAVAASFQEELCMHKDARRLYVSLGQFSIIRLERDTQLLVPVYDYCMPEKNCHCDGIECQEDPCELFRRVQFPVGEFFPPNTITPGSPGHKDNSCCGHCC